MSKKMIALILAASLVVYTAGCSRGQKEESPASSAVSSSESSSPTSSEEERPKEGTPAAAVADMLDAFKAVKMERLKAEIENAGIQELAKNAENLLKSLAENMSYELGETRITGDSAVVSAVITNNDFSGIVEQLLPSLAELALTNPNAGREEMGRLILEKLVELVENTESAPISSQVDIQLIRENEEWKLQRSQMPAELLNALSGGLFGAFQSIVDQLGFLAG